MAEPIGRPLRLDPNACSASTDLPAFLARPVDPPVYHGFPFVEESRTDDWVFGTITDYENPEGCNEGDAFVVAPDGIRAGIVWQVGTFEMQEILPPDEKRWDVYGIAFPKAICTTADFVQSCREVLPLLKQIHAKVNTNRQERMS
jgi:hypothetical protein